jgi:hypothetical protein
LPTLYRPEDGDTSLQTRALRAVARVLDGVQNEAGELMQAHWFRHADHGLYSTWLRRSRELEGDPPPAPGDREVLTFPFIADLARLGSLLALLPWREPIAQREVVEAYRRRIARIVALYRRGLGTVAALRAIVEAQLPVDVTAPAGLQDRPFTVEEFEPLATASRAVQARGAPLDVLGPLMRWALASDGLTPAVPTLYVQGVAAVPDVIDATERPAVELYAAGRRVRLAIAYEGTLAPDQTLRVRPAYTSWIGSAAGLTRANSTAVGETAADPTAPGPWSAIAGAPTEPVTAIRQTTDRALWVATMAEGTGRLWRFDGRTWTSAVSGLPEVHCLALDGDSLLLGTAGGLARLAVHPAAGPLAPVPAPAALNGAAIFALLHAADGRWWVGGAAGLARLGAGDALEPHVLRADAGTATPVYALSQDSMGAIHLGTELGLFQYQPERDHWYWYEGREHSEGRRDWRQFFPERQGAAREFPGPASAFLPPVRAVMRGPDASLWLGTDRGIARYVARATDGLAFTTLLEASPELASGRVGAIEQDERGHMWFATEQGVFRHDGRDWWQVQGASLVRLGGSPAPPGHWRFRRDTGRWEFFGARAPAGTWTPVTPVARGAQEAAALALAWTDGAQAELGAWDGTTFTVAPDAAPAGLRMRYKPEEERIVDGGLPAVPRVPPGASVWRYLALEPAVAPQPPRTFPAWTIEGRLLPPPPGRAASEEGRWSAAPPSDFSVFDDAVFSYRPAARVWMAWQPRRPLTVLARLGTLSAGERLDPAILDRVWQGFEQVRPAGVRAMLAVDNEVVRGR